MKICLKELRESHRCLRLIKRVSLIINATKADELISETLELIKIFVSSINTSKKNAQLKRIK